MLAACLVLLLAVPAAGSFVENKKDIIAVAVERARQAPDDASRALKAGENTLRRLHEGYKVGKSTPPTTLEGDVRALTAAVTKMRLARSRGENPPADPRAVSLIDERWRAYREDVDALLRDASRQGASESAAYWQALKDQERLSSEMMEDLAYNAPPGEVGVEEAAARDRWELLKRLENPERVRGLSSCVTAEDGKPAVFDIAPFYRAAGLLPGTNPLRKSAFAVPPGCRTVTRREPGGKIILRASHGRGTLLIGSQKKPLHYDYVIVPPEAPWLVENGGAGPLEVEYIVLAP